MSGFTNQGNPVSAARASSRASPLAAVLVAATLFAAALFAAPVGARVPTDAAAAANAMATVPLAELPAQARQTYRLIRAGGPFPYERDGGTFFNRERLLPPQPRGFYRAYTVPTPSARTRGARRIVCGGAQATAPEVCFYTADHYASFRRIVSAP